jgi:hypothetical protein
MKFNLNLSQTKLIISTLDKYINIHVQLFKKIYMYIKLLPLLVHDGRSMYIYKVYPLTHLTVNIYIYTYKNRAPNSEPERKHLPVKVYIYIYIDM